jgi:hypothetical protein
MELTSALASEYISLWVACTLNRRYESDLDWAIQ